MTGVPDNQQEHKGEVTVKPVNVFQPIAEIGASFGQLVVGQVCYTSHPLKTMADKISFYKSLSGTVDSADKWINRTMPVVHITVHPVEKTLEDSGEVVELMRIVFTLEDGNRVQFFSSGVAKCVSLILGMGLLPPYSPPLELLLTRIQIGNAKSMYTLDIVASDPTSARKGK